LVQVDGENPGNGEVTISYAIPGVPEPAAWGMMLIGVVGLGAVLRARRRGHREPAAFAPSG
jgi:hypothetical protein